MSGTMGGYEQYIFFILLGQRRTNMLAQRRADEQTYVGPTLNANVVPTYSVLLTQRWPNVAMLSGHGDSNAFAKYFCDIYNPGKDTSYDSNFFTTVENSYSDPKHAHSLNTCVR